MLGGCCNGMTWCVLATEADQNPISRRGVACYGASLDCGGVAAAAASSQQPAAMSSGGRESRWPEFAALRRALMARDAAVPGRELRQQHPGWRGAGDHAAAAGGDGKRAKVMHLLLWGPK